MDSKTKNWRGNAKNFRDPTLCQLKPGTVNLSPAWFQQGHEVCFQFFIISGLILICEQSSEYKLEVGAQMKAGTAGAHWQDEMQESAALISAIPAIIHPQLFHQAIDAFCILAAHGADFVEDEAQLRQALDIWTSPFSALSVITNRGTPLHRDTKGQNEWFDFLVALGEDNSLGTMAFPGLGITVDYNPATMIAITGKVIRHGAEFQGGERACISYYMRNHVHDRLGIPAGTWINFQIYEEQNRKEVNDGLEM